MTATLLRHPSGRPNRKRGRSEERPPSGPLRPQRPRKSARRVAAPGNPRAVTRTARPTDLKDHRCRLRVPSDPGAACPFGSSPRLKPVAEFGLLFKRGPGLDQPLLSDCDASTTRSYNPADSTICRRCIRWKTKIRFTLLASVVCLLVRSTTSCKSMRTNDDACFRQPWASLPTPVGS